MKEQSWYQSLIRRASEREIPAMVIFIAFYYNEARVPTYLEFDEIWGDHSNYYKIKKTFEDKYIEFIGG